MGDELPHVCPCSVHPCRSVMSGRRTIVPCLGTSTCSTRMNRVPCGLPLVVTSTPGIMISKGVYHHVPHWAEPSNEKGFAKRMIRVQTALERVRAMLGSVGP